MTVPCSSKPSTVDAWLAGTGIVPAVCVGDDALWLSNYYECRLADGQEEVDYLCAFARPAVPQLLHGWRNESSGRWEPLRDFLTRWGNPESYLAARVPFVWLEFDDVLSVDCGMLLPSVCACLVPTYKAESAVAPTFRSRQLKTAHDCLDALGMGGHEPLLAECFDALPEAGQWIHLSVMLGRTPQAIKLYGTVPRQELLGFLERVGWRGDLLAIATLLEETYGPDLFGETVLLDLNLSNFRDPSKSSLGLAVGRQHLARGPHRDPTWRAVLDRWVARSVCCPKKADAARSWVNASDRILDLKLVWQNAFGLSAKAYLGRQRLFI